LGTYSLASPDAVLAGPAGSGAIINPIAATVNVNALTALLPTGATGNLLFAEIPNTFTQGYAIPFSGGATTDVGNIYMQLFQSLDVNSGGPTTGLDVPIGGGAFHTLVAADFAVLDAIAMASLGSPFATAYSATNATALTAGMANGVFSMGTTNTATGDFRAELRLDAVPAVAVGIPEPASAIVWSVVSVVGVGLMSFRRRRAG
jgi:hypothetical protein